MSFGLLYETVIIMMMTTTTLRCISSQNFCSVWLVRQFLTSSSSPMNFGNDIEVTDKLSLQMSFCCMRRGKTKKHSRENYPDFLTSTFVFPLSFLCFPLHNSIGFSCRNATRMFSSTAHFTQEQKVIIFLFFFAVFETHCSILQLFHSFEDNASWKFCTSLRKFKTFFILSSWESKDTMMGHIMPLFGAYNIISPTLKITVKTSFRLRLEFFFSYWLMRL